MAVCTMRSSFLISALVLPLTYILYLLLPVVTSLSLPTQREASGHDPTSLPELSRESRTQEEKDELHRKWGFDWSFSGIQTFAHLDHVKCLLDPDTPFDIGIIGAPFDTAVSYRPGARFGPRAIRTASTRQSRARGYNFRRKLNPYKSNFTILDCGDIPLMPVDNGVALEMMTQAMTELGTRAPKIDHPSFPRPKLLTLGGDHSVALGALRALKHIYNQPIAVLHFDSHLDTWIPPEEGHFPWWSEQGLFNHGDVFWFASSEGLIRNGSSVHAGLRTRLSGIQDLIDDDGQGFMRLSADDIDDMGPAGIVSAIIEHIGTEIPVYLSLDIDVMDPGICPGTGTPEPGGWTSREIIRILRGLEPLNVVGADIVEVSPAYDGEGEQTALVAAQVAYEIITSWIGRGTAGLEGHTEL